MRRLLLSPVEIAARLQGDLLMLILVLLCTGLSVLAFPAHRIDTHEDVNPPPLARRLLYTSLLLYPVFLGVVASLAGACLLPRQ